jgi:hypothetical protein
MIKDRAQKSLVLKYAVGKRWLPQLEVDVLPRVSTSDAQKPLTDVDVLISLPDEFDGYRFLLVDCKTGKRESPITRALWLRGLMDQVGAARGLCVFLKEKIEQDHRYTAAQFGVLLLTEEEFEQYVRTTGGPAQPSSSHAADIDLWDRYFEIPDKFPALRQTIEFAKFGYWMCKHESEACRKTIAEAIRIRPELDPGKSSHLAIACDLSALFMHSLSRIVARVFASYLQPRSRDELADALLTLLYGGRENYEHLNSLRKLVSTAQGTAIQGGPLDGRSLAPPEWDRFLQLVRHGLDIPTELPNSPLLLRELGWSFLADKPSYQFAEMLAGEKRQAAKMAFLGVEYICLAAKLPPEFAANIGRLLLELQQPPTQHTLVFAKR